MITVRYPGGFSIQYNTGVQCSHDVYGTSIWDGYDPKKRRLIAIVQDSAGATIEWATPCRVYDALQQQPLEQLTKEVRALRRKIVKR